MLRTPTPEESQLLGCSNCQGFPLADYCCRCRWISNDCSKCKKAVATEVHVDTTTSDEKTVAFVFLCRDCAKQVYAQLGEDDSMQGLT